LGAVLGATTHCGDGGCDCAGVGTVAKPSQPYRGSANATLPYVDVGKMSLGQNSCQGNICSYGAGLHPWVHNPTTVKVTIKKMSCQYFVDDVPTAKSGTLWNIEIPARSSRQLLGFDYLFDLVIGMPAGVAARCTVDFGPKYPVSTDDAN